MWSLSTWLSVCFGLVLCWCFRPLPIGGAHRLKYSGGQCVNYSHRSFCHCVQVSFFFCWHEHWHMQCNLSTHFVGNPTFGAVLPLFFKTDRNKTIIGRKEHCSSSTMTAKQHTWSTYKQCQANTFCRTKKERERINARVKWPFVHSVPVWPIINWPIGRENVSLNDIRCLVATMRSMWLSWHHGGVSF